MSEHEQPVASGPLAGVRVVDVSRMQAGPLATMVLGDMGADVVKIEPIGKGDHMRRMGIHYLGPENTYFLSVNRSKRGVAVDLRSAEGIAIVRQLARTADVFVENFRPGVVAKMGLDYATLAGDNPRLVYCSVSAFGQGGPLGHKPGIDPVLQGFSGLMSVTGERGGPPAMVGAPVVDTMAAMLAVQGVVMALFARERSGLGQKVELSLLDAALVLLTPREGPYFASGTAPERWGSAHAQHVPHQAFETRDGWLNVDVIDDEAWRRLCVAVGRPEWADDPRYARNKARLDRRAEVVAMLEPIFQERTSGEWVDLLERQEVIAGPVHTLDQALSHPQVLHNQMVVSAEHPAAGTVRMLGMPLHFSRTPGAVRRPPPLLGQHTDEVLGEFGYSAAAIADLRARGIVG